MNKTHGLNEDSLALYNKLFLEQKAGFYDVEYYAWPQVFSSTCGPYGGIGGDALTTFTIEAIHNIMFNTTLYLCGGCFQKGYGRINPFSVLPESGWIRLV